MAKIKLTKGQLYFLREKDYLTGEISRYVKIGLVRNEKGTDDRISEHQTGNPREIYDYCSIESPFVEHLETLIHYRLAEKWIVGEWLDLNENEIEQAIKECKEIIQEQEAIKEELEESYSLVEIESSGDIKKPSDKAQEIWEQLITVKLDIDQLNAKKAIVNHRLKTIMGKSNGIDGVVNLIFKDGQTRFNDKEFAEENPELYKKYITKETIKRSSTFTIKGKKTLKKENPELAQEKKELEKIEVTASDINRDQQAERNEEVAELHAQYINLQKEIYTSEWEYAQLEAKLKVQTGKSDGIEGLCGWKRESTPAVGFNKKEFQENHPELYDKYCFTEPENFSFNVNSFRPYYVGK